MHVSRSNAGFDEGGKILYLAVAVLMSGVGGPVGNVDREQSDDGCDEVEYGVGRLRQYAETSGGNSHGNFQRW